MCPPLSHDGGAWTASPDIRRPQPPRSATCERLSQGWRTVIRRVPQDLDTSTSPTGRRVEPPSSSCKKRAPPAREYSSQGRAAESARTRDGSRDGDGGCAGRPFTSSPQCVGNILHCGDHHICLLESVHLPIAVGVADDGDPRRLCCAEIRQ